MLLAGGGVDWRNMEDIERDWEEKRIGMAR